MGKKYIVEIGRLERLYKAYTNGNGKPNLTWLSPEVDLTPYTEPDLEQVRKEGYEDGYNAGFGRKIDASYQEGLSDAWKAASEIAVIPYDEVEKIFGATGWHIFMKCTASEVIEKLIAYEQEKEEKQHTWIFSEVNEPSVDTTMICSKCGYTITIKPGDTQALNFCPKCGDDKRGKQDE